MTELGDFIISELERREINLGTALDTLLCVVAHSINTKVPRELQSQNFDVAVETLRDMQKSARNLGLNS